LGMELMSEGRVEEQVEQDLDELEGRERRRWAVVLAIAFPVLAVGLVVVLLAGPILQGKNRRLLRYKAKASAFVTEREFARAISMYQRALALNPSDVGTRELIARCRLQQGDLSEAIAEYRRCLRKIPQDTQLQLTLASLHLLAKNDDRAKEILDSILEEEPDKVLALIMEAQCYYERKNNSHPLVNVNMITDIVPSTASPYNLPTGSDSVGASSTDENGLVQAVQDSPDKIQPHKNLADFYRRQKRLAEAEAQYKKMVEVAPQDPYVYLHLADFYRAEETARLPEAITQYSKVLLAIDPKNLFALRGICSLFVATGKLTDAKRYVDKLLWEYPSDAYARYFRGILEVYDGDVGRAERDFLFVSKEVSEYSDAHYLLGYTYLVNHAMAKAENSLEQAAKVDPTCGHPRLLLAEIALNLEEYKRALEILDQLSSIEKQKDNPLAYLMRGRIHVAQNDPAGAEAPFTKLAELDGESVHPMLLLGEVYKRTGKNDQAVAQYKAAISANPGSALPSYLLGLLYEGMGDQVLAMSYYEDAVRKAPNLAVAVRSLADAYFSNSGGKSADAKALGKTLLDRFKNNYTLLDALAAVFYQQNEFDKAVEVLELIPGQERDVRPQIVYHYAMALYRSKRNSEARKELEKAIRWMRQLPGAEDVEKTLDEVIGAKRAAG